MTTPREDQELVEAVSEEIFRQTSDRDDVSSIDLARAIIPIVRQHYEQQIAKLEVMLEGNAAVAVIRQDEREKIAQDFPRWLDKNGWHAFGRREIPFRNFFYDYYGIEVGP